jgi:hypothetical protein
MIKVLEARVVTGFTVWLRFDDGTEGRVDLTSELHGPVFEALRDPGYFAQLRVDPELDTLAWPNGADFAPEFLYEQVKRTAA